MQKSHTSSGIFKAHLAKIRTAWLPFLPKGIGLHWTEKQGPKSLYDPAQVGKARDRVSNIRYNAQGISINIRDYVEKSMIKNVWR